jgi:molecular chaperone GrpE (heat shock protein)
MKDIMLAELPVEQRAQILKDSCDKIEERSYLSKYDQEETNLLRAELANVSIQLGTIQEELDRIKSDYKGKLKPLQERIDKIRKIAPDIAILEV